MKLCVLLGFNNYYNRKIIKYDTLAEYQEYIIKTIDNYQFKYADGINTRIIINFNVIVDNVPFSIEAIPDYVILAQDNNEIVSRWFIMEWNFKSKGMYEATLRRDLVADNLENIIEAPCFIEKATITDKNDVALFNNENMSFNQIKTSETMLKDLTNCPWIVGYVPSDTDWDDNGSYAGPELVIDLPVGDPITLTLVKASASDFNGKFLKSMPFKMFCMPYADLDFVSRGGMELSFTTNKELMVAFATNISKTMGSGAIFDLQLLPYCPLRTEDGTLLFGPQPFPPYEGKYIINDFNVESYMIAVKGETLSSTTVKGVFYWCDVNKFSFDIDYSLQLPSTALEIKVKNETEMYRLCSPNYNGQFEFNPMKNGGVTKFNVDCMYQPFNPYIHINPDFGKLYGADYDDARGLICQGDFSFPQETNAWVNFVQNNKNYQNIFDRQIENMEFNNRIAMASQIVSSMTGAGQGAVAGLFLGGPIGAAVGATASGIGGIADTMILHAQQKETLDYTKDQFGYQLGNIKAMPNSISKTNPFTNNNKIFPVLEYYTCTDTEKQALKDKLKYNGMTVMRIGKIKDWLQEDFTYIKGKIIELDIEDEYHSAVEIAQEIDKGIRVKKGE